MGETIRFAESPEPAALRLEAGPEQDQLRFNVAAGEVLRFEANGDIFVHGRLVENDKQVVDGFREWLAIARRDSGLDR